MLPVTGCDGWARLSDPLPIHLILRITGQIISVHPDVVYPLCEYTRVNMQGLLVVC